MTPTEKILSDAWEPVSEQTGPEWVSENFGLSDDSELKNFNLELFPLAVFVLMQLCHNEHLRRFTEMVSAQVGKTATILGYVLWAIKNRPRSMGWYTDTNINAKGDFKTKILTAMEACAKIAPFLPSDRAKKNNTLIQFGFMNFRIMGAETRSNREGKTFSEALCDEVRNYPPGAMQQIDNRFKTITNHRRILFSSAGDTTNEPYLSFNKGTRHMGFWICPHCQHKQTFRFGRDESPLYPERRAFGGFIWADNEKTHPSELVYNMAELFPTIRYQCENEKCKHEFKEFDKTALIREMGKRPNAGFEQTNPMANPLEDISVHCWEAYMPFAGCSWSSIVEKFLNAYVAMKQGNLEPMKIFVKETLGEPWEDRGEKLPEGEIMKRCGEYSRGEAWGDEREVKTGPRTHVGQITADIQHGFIHINYSVFDRDGNKRTIERDTLLNFDELRAYQLTRNVKDRAVGIDCAHKPSEVFAACMKYGRWIADPTGGKDHIWDGWVPLIGSDQDEFTSFVLDKDKNRIATKTPFKAAVINSNEGKAGGPKHIQRFSWSGPHYKTQLYIYRIAGKGLGWEIYKNIEGEYIKQMQATSRRSIVDASGQVTGYEWNEKGRHDDGDCEAMQLVLADINNITKR